MATQVAFILIKWEIGILLHKHLWQWIGNVQKGTITQTGNHNTANQNSNGPDNELYATQTGNTNYASQLTDGTNNNLQLLLLVIQIIQQQIKLVIITRLAPQ